MPSHVSRNKPQMTKWKSFFRPSNLIAGMLLAASVALLAVSTVDAVETGTVPEATKPSFGQSGPGIEVAQACGHYIILGCFKSHAAAGKHLDALGGPGVGGQAGANVVHTNDYANFRNGWFCVADGPYRTRSQAESIAWKEAVPDAYVKKGC